jgi:hypothetical protein
MNLEERREWLEASVGKLPDILWGSLVDDHYATAGQMEEGDEELLFERAKFGLRLARWGRRRHWSDAPDLRRIPRKDPYSHPLFMSKAKLRHKVFAECVAHAAAKHPEVLAFREKALESFPLTYKQALHYVDQDGNVRESAPHSDDLKAVTEMLALLPMERRRCLLVRSDRELHAAGHYSYRRKTCRGD